MMITKKLVPRICSVVSITLALSACGSTLPQIPTPLATVRTTSSTEKTRAPVPSRTPSLTKPQLPSRTNLETITTYDRSYGFQVCQATKQELARVTMLLSDGESLDSDGTDLLNYLNDLSFLWDACLDLGLSLV